MATLTATTSWSAPKNTTTVVVTLSQAAAAGHTLVLYAAGGASVTAAVTNLAGSLTKRAQAVSSLGLFIWDCVAAGGETSLTLTLNGAENMAGCVYELNPGSGTLAFQSSAVNNAGTNIGASNDFICKPSTAATLASGNGLLVGGWAVLATAAAAPYSAGGANSWRQMGPLGKLQASGALQPGANTQFIWTSGLADITAAAQYPADQAAGSFVAASQYVGVKSGNAWMVSAVYADTSGVATNPAPATAIAGENTLPGTDSTNWFLGSTAMVNSTIAGYTDKTSYQPSETVNFKVDSTGHPFRVEIYRLGWYGWDTFGARNVLGNGSGYITGTPAAQFSPTVDPVYGSTSCAWTTTATWTVPPSAVPGFYFVLYRRTDITANVAAGFFIVRPAAATGKVAVVLPDTTYAAYNNWGATTDANGALTGRSLYHGGADASFANRAYAVSFDRPWATGNNQRNTFVFDAEFGACMFLEAQGYDLAYLSCIDLDNNQTLLNDAAMVIMLGHHEYWTAGIYNAFTAAVEAGVSMMVYSGNTALWHTRFAVGDIYKRLMICYKDSGTKDVSAGWTGTGFDPVSYTGTWRDTRTVPGQVNNPDIRRENLLTGQLFNVNAPVNVAYGVPFASKTAPIWRNSPGVQALTTGQTYSQTTSQGGNIGAEADAPDGSSGQPANLVQLCPTSATFTGQCANAAGSVYTSTLTLSVGFTLYRRGSGALVFHTGTWRGWQGIARWAQAANIGTVVATPDVNWQNAFLCVMYDLGQKPATLTAMRPVADTALTDPATGAPGTNRNVIAAAYGLAVPAASLLPGAVV